MVYWWCIVLLKQKITSKFYQKSGVKRWCKMGGGVIGKTTGDNNEKYFFPRKNFHFNPE